MLALHALIDLIFPPRCIVSGDLVDRQGMLSPQAWGALNFISDPQCYRCGYPFDFDMSGEKEKNLCGGCLKKPPVFNTARAALVYDDASRDIILGFKHGDQTESVPSFIPWLNQAGKSSLEEADYLVPVPLHRYRLWKRRFNQSALIAQYLSRDSKIPTLLNLLVRNRSTVTQGHLKPDQRQRNVRNAFEVNQKLKDAIKNRKIILIDDVYTTGATVSECSKVLLKNGAASVNILTLARVVRASRL